MRGRPGLRTGRPGQRRAIDPSGDGVVSAIKAEMDTRFQIEIEHEKQDLFETVRKVGLALRSEIILSQAVEVAVKRSENRRAYW